MAEYIKKEDIEQKIQNGLNNLVLGHAAIEVLGMIYEMPAADVAPVRHGRWEARAIPRSDPDGDWIALEYHCSLCNRLEYRKENYCPNCGAIMNLEGAKNGKS